MDDSFSNPYLAQIAELSNQIADLIRERDALRARLAAAERVCVDARRVMKGMEPLDSEDAFTLHDLKSSLAAYDAAKGETDG